MSPKDKPRLFLINVKYKDMDGGYTRYSVVVERYLEKLAVEEAVGLLPDTTDGFVHIICNVIEDSTLIQSRDFVTVIPYED